MEARSTKNGGDEESRRREDAKKTKPVNLLGVFAVILHGLRALTSDPPCPPW